MFNIPLWSIGINLYLLELDHHLYLKKNNTKLKAKKSIIYKAYKILRNDKIIKSLLLTILIIQLCKSKLEFVFKISLLKELLAGLKRYFLADAYIAPEDKNSMFCLDLNTLN